MPLHLILLVIFAISAITMVGLARVYERASLAKYRIREERVRKLQGMRLYKSVLSNSTVSAVLVFAVVYGFYPHLVHVQHTSWWWMSFEAAAILLLYDFLYYLTHRFAFHEWKVLKPVHAVHHMAKYPRAMDSLWLHPLEMCIGLGLLLLCTWIVGPVHEYTFALAFFVYSILNIVIHCGLDLPFPFRVLGFLARKHDKHHVSMRGGNYASITPIFDILFGTAE